MESYSELLEGLYKGGSILTGVTMGILSVYDLSNEIYNRATIEALSSGFILSQTFLLNRLSNRINYLEEEETKIETDIMERDIELRRYKKAMTKIENIIESLHRRRY